MAARGSLCAVARNDRRAVARENRERVYRGSSGKLKSRKTMCECFARKVIPVLHL